MNARYRARTTSRLRAYAERFGVCGWPRARAVLETYSEPTAPSWWPDASRPIMGGIKKIREKKRNAYPGHQRRRHSRAGPQNCEEIARRCPTTSGQLRRSTISPACRISLSLTIRALRQIGERHYAVKGTRPIASLWRAACAVESRRRRAVPASNRGRNAAEDVLYSGTVAAAKEACVLGIPSFALSQAHSANNKHQSGIGRPRSSTAPDINRSRAEAGIPRTCWSNINFPDCPPGAVKGVSVSSQGQAPISSFCISTRATMARQSVLLDRL